MGNTWEDEVVRRARERFGPRADAYRASPTHAEGRDLDLLVEWLDPQPAERALDVATGGGHVALALARNGADVDACDITPEMLETAGGLLADNGCTATFTVAEAARLPYADATFDIVTCRIAAHHFPDAQVFFAEAARVLKPGGRLGFEDQALPPEGPSAALTDAFERTRDRSHVQAYNVDGWITMIERAGLEVVHTELVDKRHDFAEWTSRQDCSEETLASLREQMLEAPDGMRRWLEPAYEDEWLVSFRHRYVVVLARKPS